MELILSILHQLYNAKNIQMSKIIDDRLSIVVVSYDGYNDMWNSFFECKEIFWPKCPYETLLANNIIDYHRVGVRTLNCGHEAQWSVRTRMALQSVKTKYVCFLLEDFFISSHVQTQNIENAIDLMESDNLKYYKLMSFSNIKAPNYKSYPHLIQIPDNYPYGISLMAAIWDKDFFLEKIGDGNYNPWKFEVDRLKEENNKTGDILLGVYDKSNPLNICHMVVQGKYLPPSVKHMKKCGVKIDLGARGVMSLWSYGIYLFKRWASQWSDRYPLLNKIIHLFYSGSVTAKFK